MTYGGESYGEGSYGGDLLGRGVSLFSPTDIPGLTSWLSADSLDLGDGDHVSSWVDLSGNGNDGTKIGSGALTWRDGDYVLPQVLIDNANSASATTVTTETFTDYEGDLVVSATLTGAADWLDIGILDSAQSETVNSLGLSVSGFYGVRLDIYGGSVKCRVGTSEYGSGVGHNARTSDDSHPSTWRVRYSVSGGSLSIQLLRDGTSVATWSGITLPTFSSWRMAVGARTGGLAGKFAVHGRAPFFERVSSQSETSTALEGASWSSNNVYRKRLPVNSPVVMFDRSAWLEFPSGMMTGATGGEAFARVVLLSPAESSLWNFGSMGDTSHYPYSSGQIYEQFGRTSRTPGVTPGVALASEHTYSVSTSAAARVLYQNGSPIYTEGSGTVGWASVGLLGGGYGASDYSARRLEGFVREFAIFNRVLDAGEREFMVDWMAGVRPEDENLTLALAGTVTPPAADVVLETHAETLNLAGTIAAPSASVVLVRYLDDSGFDFFVAPATTIPFMPPTAHRGFEPPT